MTITKIIFTFIAFACFVGCGTTLPQIENMVCQGRLKNYSETLNANIELGYVVGSSGKDSGGRHTISNEVFSTAVKKSLAAEGLLSDDGRFLLNIKILKLDPSAGASWDLTSHVKYQLIDLTNYEIIFSETIVTSHSGKAFNGYKRVQLANEGSGRKNIEAFIEKLSALKI